MTVAASHILRVVWPILDPGMFNDEAIAQAWFQWSQFPEAHQVTVLGTPSMRVEELGADERKVHGAVRGVVCTAPVTRRVGRAA